VKRKLALGASLAAAGVFAFASPAAAQEATEIPLDDTQMILDNTFVFLCAVLVLFMQAGFAMLTAGLTRAKSVSNILMKNMMDMSVGILVFALIGYHIAYSGADLIGFSWLFGGYADAPTTDYSLMLPVDFLFQAAFAAAAATIVAGALAERTQFKGYLFYSVFITGLIYPVVVNWQWGGGWLSQLGTPFEDFAGSTLVHSVGGWAAMMGALIIGPRIGKYGPDGKPRPMPGHSMALTVIGVFILFVGWFGFNPGSQLAADIEVPRIAVNTALAACAGGVTAMITSWITAKKPDVSMAGNGILAGLVSITAGAFALDGFGSIIAGAIGGVLVVFAVLFFERIRIDDPVGAVSVHGVCGAWGTIAVGLFANGNAPFLDEGSNGLFFGGGASLLVSQLIGVVAVFVFVCVAAGILFSAIKAIGWLRVSPEEELAGLDVSEHGSPGYHMGDAVTVGSGTGASTGAARESTTV
jgi:ammonium transporter, Amt family